MNHVVGSIVTSNVWLENCDNYAHGMKKNLFFGVNFMHKNLD
jgi:hypothetical protein